LARALGIDYGERRIGLAVSDPTATLAQPLPPLLRRRGKRAPIHALLQLLTAQAIDRVVVGLPLSLDGGDSDWTREVRDFASRLAARSGLEVYLLDERLTSVMAERAVRSLGLRRHEREEKHRVDTAAAILILQSFLDRMKSGHPPERAAGSADPQNRQDVAEEESS
jgi:putative Holliday junction resolvase